MRIFAHTRSLTIATAAMLMLGLPAMADGDSALDWGAVSDIIGDNVVTTTQNEQSAEFHENPDQVILSSSWETDFAGASGTSASGRSKVIDHLQTGFTDMEIDLNGHKRRKSLDTTGAFVFGGTATGSERSVTRLTAEGLQRQAMVLGADERGNRASDHTASQQFSVRGEQEAVGRGNARAELSGSMTMSTRSK